MLNIGRDESPGALTSPQVPESCHSVLTRSNNFVVRELREIQITLLSKGQFLLQDLPVQSPDPAVWIAVCTRQHEIAAFEGLNVPDPNVVVSAAPVLRLPACLQVEHLQQSSACL